MLNHCPREIFESSKNDPAVHDIPISQDHLSPALASLPRREQTTIYEERENSVCTLD